MTSLESTVSSRPLERFVAALVALLSVSFAVSCLTLFRRALADGRYGAGIAAVAFMILFAGVAIWQGWYAWRGWMRSGEGRVSRAVRWGAAGFVLWGLLGSLLTVAFTAIALSRDAGLLPMFAWFSAPLGAIIGVVRALRHR